MSAGVGCSYSWWHFAVISVSALWLSNPGYRDAQTVDLPVYHLYILNAVMCPYVRRP